MGRGLCSKPAVLGEEAPVSDRRTPSAGRHMECQQEATAPLWRGLSLPVVELEGPLESIGSNAPCLCRKEIQRGTDLFMIAQLDGVHTGLVPWLLGSLTSSVVVFVLILCNGPTACLGGGG